MQARTCFACARPKRDQRSASCNLGVATVGIVQAEVRHHLRSTGLDDVCPVTCQNVDCDRDVRVFLARAVVPFENERGDVATLARCVGAFSVGQLERRARTLNAHRRHFNRRSFGRERVTFVELGGGHRRNRRLTLVAAKARHEHRELVRSETQALAIEEREERFIHASSVGKSRRGILV